MDDPPRSRSRRFLLAGLLIVLIRGCIAPAVANGQSDATAGDAVYQGRTPRLGSFRPPLGPAEFHAIPAAEPVLAVSVTFVPAHEHGAPWLPAPPEPVGRAALPRAPPRI